MSASSVAARGGIRAKAAGIGLVAVLAVIAAACAVPAQPAGSLFDAWRTNNHAAAAAVATPTAVSQMFSQPYSSVNNWFFNRCDGAAGSTFCTWIDNVEARIEMRITNATGKVSEVKRIPMPSFAAGRTFHYWRVGSSSAATPYATDTARFELFAKPYSASDHWSPQGCEGAAGSLYCTWTNDAAKTIILRVNQVSSPLKVIEVSGTFHP